jgi:hypothetical protein
MQSNQFWISVTELFRRGVEDVLNQVAEHVGDTKTLVAYNNRLARLVDVRDIDLHIEEITGRDKTVDEVVEIFNRVNSGGTKLSAGDLALLASVRTGLKLVLNFAACCAGGATQASTLNKSGCCAVRPPWPLTSVVQRVANSVRRRVRHCVEED